MLEHTVEEAAQGDPSLSGSARDAGVEFGHDPLSVPDEVGTGEMRGEESNTATDVEAHSTGRDHTSVVDVGRRHASNREAVSPVDVGHCIRGTHDAGEVRHVGHLIDRPILPGLHDQ